MVAGTTGNENKPATATDDRQVRPEATERDRVGVEVDATTHCVDDGLGLLVDLLLHESVEFPLHDSGDLELENLDAPGGSELSGGLLLVASATQTVDVKLTLGNMGDVVILEVQDTLGVFDNGGGVRRDEELDGLGKSILGHERARLGAHHLGLGRGDEQRVRG